SSALARNVPPDAYESRANPRAVTAVADAAITASAASTGSSCRRTIDKTSNAAPSTAVSPSQTLADGRGTLQISPSSAAGLPSTITGTRQRPRFTPGARPRVRASCQTTAGRVDCTTQWTPGAEMARPFFRSFAEAAVGDAAFAAQPREPSRRNGSSR